MKNPRTGHPVQGQVKQLYKSALAELRSTTGCLQTVLLALLHTRIAGQQTGLLKGTAQFRIGLAQGTADAVADRAGLTGQTAAVHVHQCWSGSGADEQSSSGSPDRNTDQYHAC